MTLVGIIALTLLGIGLIVSLSVIPSGLAIAVQYLRAARALNKEARHG